jgi:hypothetical protein
MKQLFPGALLLLAGCVHREPPMLAINAGAACDPMPRFETAVPVALDRSASASLGPLGRCLAPPGTASPTTYVVFQLPDVAPYTLNISSLYVNGPGLTGDLVFPRVTLYDAAGTPGRVLGAPDFRANVNGLTAGLRTKGGERWLVVEADPARVGQPVLLRLGDAGMTQLAATIFIYVPPPNIPDVVRERSATYTLNGLIQVSTVTIPILR